MPAQPRGQRIKRWSLAPPRTQKWSRLDSRHLRTTESSRIGLGNFRPQPAVLFLGEKKGASHVHTPALVHPLRALLATGHAGVDRVSLHLAAAAPLSHPGSRCPRSSGDRLSSHHATLPPADSAVSDLNCGGFSVVAGEVVETLPCNLSFPAEKRNQLGLYDRGSIWWKPPRNVP